MNIKNLNIIGICLLGLAIFSLSKGLGDAFLVFLFLSSSMFGAACMKSLIEKDINIKKSNLKLAILGILFGVVSMFTSGVIELVCSFAFGSCFGLIGAALIFEKHNG